MEELKRIINESLGRQDNATLNRLYVLANRQYKETGDINNIYLAALIGLEQVKRKQSEEKHDVDAMVASIENFANNSD